MRRLLASLTARLVLTTVALVVVVAALIGAAATVALDSRLTAQVDDRLYQATSFSRGGGDHDEDNYGGVAPRYCPNGLPLVGGPNLQPGALTADLGGTVQYAVIRGGGPCDATSVSSAAVRQLRGLTPDAHSHSIDLSGLGSFRVIAYQQQSTGDVVIIGLPTHDVESAVDSLIVWEVALILLGALVATAGGLFLVRRQLRPLTEVAETAHEVAALPLSEGAVDLSARVPAELTDERTEVGQVGAALNTLLAHVETSLEARHRSEQQVRQFVADASHELRTPLATIAGYTELARRRPDDEHAVATAIAKVEEESARMTALVEDLLLLARLDAGRPLEREPVDLTRLLVEAVDDARVVAPEHHWRLELPEAEPAADEAAGAELDAEEPDTSITITGDERRLHQVVTNLLTNARKYTPPGTTVTVRVRVDGFDVHDDGPGFPPDFVDKAFERFARVDPARQRVGGAGLGLSLVQAIVKSHGGTVALHSAPGDTEVMVRLPEEAADR